MDICHIPSANEQHGLSEFFVLKGIVQPEKGGGGWERNQSNRLDFAHNRWCFWGKFKGPWTLKNGFGNVGTTKCVVSFDMAHAIQKNRHFCFTATGVECTVCGASFKNVSSLSLPCGPAYVPIGPLSPPHRTDRG